LCGSCIPQMPPLPFRHELFVPPTPVGRAP
jgi:hypothetical protein